MKRQLAHLTVSSFTSFLFILLQSILAVGLDDRQQAHDPAQSLLKTALQQKAEEIKSLRVRAGAPFKIALFADLHFGEDAWTEWGPQQDVNSVEVMSSVLDDETPDFVIYLGDVITANNIPIANASLYWDKAISPTRARGIPWASVFGNHDDAPFEWPVEWFSPPGIPPIDCPAPNASSCSGIQFPFQGKNTVASEAHNE